MFLIFLIVALLLAIPTYGISIVIFIGFYAYKSISMKSNLTQLIASLPDGTTDSIGYKADIRIEQVLAYAKELGVITLAPSSYNTKYKDGINKTSVGLPEYVEFEIVIDGLKYKVSAQKNGNSSVLKRIGNPVSLNIYSWMSSFYYSTLDMLPNDLFLKKKIVLGSASCPEYRKDIGSLPVDFFKLTNIEELHLQNCNLTLLQEDIINLHKLKDLKLGGNMLSTLPHSIGYLKNLKILTVWINDLVLLPDEIGFLVNLEGLDLSSNPIRKLPESIINLTNLKNLDLSQVPNLSLSIEQKEWISKLKNNGCKVFADSRLLVAGQKVLESKIPF